MDNNTNLKRIRSRIIELGPVGMGWDSVDAIAQVMTEEQDRAVQRFDEKIALLNREISKARTRTRSLRSKSRLPKRLQFNTRGLRA